jgi:hypothetical protein
MGDDERREAILERRRAVLDVARLGEEERFEGRAGATASAAELVDPGDVGDAQSLEAVGFVPGALQFVRRGSFSKIEQRSGDVGDGDPVVDGDFVGGEIAAMHLDP